MHGDRFRAHRIQAVADNGAGRANADQEVEQDRIVVIEHPAMAAATTLQRVEFGAPLGETEK